MSSGIEEKKKAGNYLKIFSLKDKKSSHFLCSKNWSGKAEAPHGQVRTSWSGWNTGGKCWESESSGKNMGITAWDCKGGVRIDKGELKLNFMSVRSNKKGFYRYPSKIWEMLHMDSFESLRLQRRARYHNTELSYLRDISSAQTDPQLAQLLPPSDCSYWEHWYYIQSSILVFMSPRLNFL